MKKGQATRERLIEEAHRLALRKGFDRTSVNDVMDAAHVKKGAFYHYFKDKDALGLAVLERNKAGFLAMIDETLSEGSPLDRLERFFKRALQYHAGHRFVGGCLWGNTALEMSDTNPVFTAFVDEVFASWIEKLETVVRDGQKCGEIRKDISAKALARTIVAAVEGGIMLSRLKKERGPMKDSLAAMLRMLAPQGMKKRKVQGK